MNDLKKASFIYKNLLNPKKEYWNDFYGVVFSIKELGYRSIFPLLGHLKFNNASNPSSSKFIKNFF